MPLIPNLFVTPHALEQFQQRIASMEEIKARRFILTGIRQAANVKLLPDGNTLRIRTQRLFPFEFRAYCVFDEARGHFVVTTIVRGNGSVRRKRRHASLLLQTVVVPGIKVDEGQVIEVVDPLWFEIIEHLKKDPAIAYNIPDRMWEELVAGAYKRAGFDEVILTPRSGDHGRDVIAIKRGLGPVRVIDQVKAYKPGHLVTADDVRALIGVLHGDGASKGFLTTTSDFAPKLKDDPLISQFIPSRLDLINGKLLFHRLEELSKKNLV